MGDLENSSNAHLAPMKKKIVEGSIVQRWLPHPIYGVIIVVLAETLAAAILLFFACMAGIQWAHPLTHLGGAINAGLTVMYIVQIFSHICHSVLNPAVALACWIANILSWKMFIVYVIAECVGSYLGYLALSLVTPHKLFFEGHGPGFCLTQIHPDVNLAQAFFIEFAITGIFILVCCSLWDPKTPKDGAAVKVGLTVFALLLAAGPFTGPSLNPARSFAPALFHNWWTNQWLYWLAPMSGSLVASLLYKWFYLGLNHGHTAVEKHEPREHEIEKKQSV